MSRITQTKQARMIVGKSKLINGQPHFKVLGYRPAQPREERTFTANIGRNGKTYKQTFTTLCAPGEIINPEKWWKRHQAK